MTVEGDTPGATSNRRWDPSPRPARRPLGWPGRRTTHPWDGPRGHPPHPPTRPTRGPVPMNNDTPATTAYGRLQDLMMLCHEGDAFPDREDNQWWHARGYSIVMLAARIGWPKEGPVWDEAERLAADITREMARPWRPEE